MGSKPAEPAPDFVACSYMGTFSIFHSDVLYVIFVIIELDCFIVKSKTESMHTNIKKLTQNEISCEVSHLIYNGKFWHVSNSNTCIKK